MTDSNASPQRSARARRSRRRTRSSGTSSPRANKQSICLRSMTGFASAQSEWQGILFQVEVRSVNHRFLDLKLRIPKEFSSWEGKLRKEMEAKLQRGSVELRIEVQADSPQTGHSWKVDQKQAIELMKALKKVSRATGLKEDPRLSDLLKLSAWIQPVSASPLGNLARQEQAEKKLQRTLKEALSSLQKEREKEGKRLGSFFLTAFKQLSAALTKIESERKKIQKNKKQDYQKRILKLSRELSSGIEKTWKGEILDWMQQKIASDLAFFVEKSDIEEEIQRAHGHLEELETFILQNGPHGRKMEFLAQELQREFHTMGNKIASAEISRTIVDAKLTIEQIREQALNVE